ncbi:hypothetical protein HNR62_000342 [Oceanisphaera litoralis]|uniref:hypothetical protein n=1 Tax=Oceanisphaera litoralis TaxID=225144 RepID=UPI00195A9C04|nr:hypothetical protein [Oceanisphaera litoralis]MBM7454513.1 hypothetical protein [Oceanisphaera litoralis]
MPAKRSVYDFLLTAALRWQFRLLENPKAKGRGADLRKFIKDCRNQFDERAQKAIRNILYQPHMVTYIYDQYYWFMLGEAPCEGANLASSSINKGLENLTVIEERRQ